MWFSVRDKMEKTSGGTMGKTTERTEGGKKVAIFCGLDKSAPLCALWLIVGVLVMAGCGVSAGPAQRAAVRVVPADDFFVYVSSAARVKPNPILLYRLHVATMTLTLEGTVAELPEPNFLALSPNQKALYVTCNPKEGEVAAFAIDGHTGKLSALNQQPSGGHRAVHVSVDPTGRAVLAANYVGNTVEALGIDADGSLKAPAAGSVQTHAGSGPNRSRQSHPFAAFDLCGPDGSVRVFMRFGNGSDLLL